MVLLIIQFVLIVIRHVWFIFYHVRLVVRSMLEALLLFRMRFDNHKSSIKYNKCQKGIEHLYAHFLEAGHNDA